MKQSYYNDLLSTEEQVDMEESIAALIFDRQDFAISEEQAADLGRIILKLLLRRLRPEVFDDIDPWLCDHLQFPRLIAEVEASGGFTEPLIAKLAEECDLSTDQVCEIITRAQTQHDHNKSCILLTNVS